MILEQQKQGTTSIEAHLEAGILQSSKQTVDTPRRRQVNQHTRDAAPDDEIPVDIEQDVNEHAGDFHAHPFESFPRSRHRFVPCQQVNYKGRERPIVRAKLAGGADGTRAVSYTHLTLP